jgi:glycosyltransferase involved in cell wall biosynthesis
MHRPAITIVVPAFNEERTVGFVISDIISVMGSLQYPYEIIVVDDGSTDNTRRIASTYKATVLFNDKNQGKGHAMRRAFQRAEGEIIVTIDADGAHSAKEIPDIITPIFHGADIVAGSRFSGRGKESTSTLNRIGNLLFNTTIMVFTGKRITDSQTGFRAFKKEVLQKLMLTSSGYEIETEITVKGLRNGFTFLEKPITCEKRKHDVSKLRILSDGSRILKALLKANFEKIEH